MDVVDVGDESASDEIVVERGMAAIRSLGSVRSGIEVLMDVGVVTVTVV